MNLIRFLSAGDRGLAQGAPPMGRYRLPSGRVIPEFGARKNPFTAPKTSPSQTSPPSAMGVTAKAALTQAAPPLPVPSVAAAAPAGGGAPTARVPRGWRWLTGQCGAALASLKALGSWRPWAGLRTTRARRPAPQPQGPVQGELRLENVRVVRNDFSDGDYEVVCAETSTASPVRRDRVLAGGRAMAPLGRLAERLFGSDS